jgi:putative toxin-antitoxin system antitoxin component (TIGR02293 family)
MTRLTLELSIEIERLERIALIENEADNVFGQSDRARDWLTKNNVALGATPLSMLDTENGAAEVRKVLSSIAYGGTV